MNKNITKKIIALILAISIMMPTELLAGVSPLNTSSSAVLSEEMSTGNGDDSILPEDESGTDSDTSAPADNSDTSVPADDSDTSVPADDSDTSAPADDSEVDDSITDDSIATSEPDTDNAAHHKFTQLAKGTKLSESQLAKKASLASSPTISDLQNANAGTDYVANEILYLTNDEDDANKVAAAYNGTLKSYHYGVAVITLADNASVIEALLAAADPTTNLPAVSANIIHKLIIPPSTAPERKTMSAFSDSIAPQRQSWKSLIALLGSNADPALLPVYMATTQYEEDYQYMHEAIGTYAAWGQLESLGKGVNVAVIDSGVNSTHEDLQGRVTHEQSFVPNLEPISGEENNHGTHVAGIIAATLGNGKGGAGIAPQANILNLRVLDDTGYGTTDGILSAINYVVNPGGERRADIINMSLGDQMSETALDEAIQVAIDKGIVVVASAGNTGSNSNNYPALYDNVISVGSTSQSGYRSSFSSYGPKITISAPGGNIYSTAAVSGAGPSNTSYKIMSGTSMSTPVVSGVIALYLGSLFAANPAYAMGDANRDNKVDKDDVTFVKNAITSTANPAKSAGIGKSISAEKLLAPIFESVSLSVEADGVQNIDVKYAFSKANAKAKFVLGDGSVANSYLVYTTNGSTPSATNGTVYDKENPIIDLSKFAKGKLTIKAIVINPLGVASKVQSYSLTLTDALTTKPTLTGIIGTSVLYIGKSSTFTTDLVPGSDKSKKLIWSIENLNNIGKSYASISQSGVLTIKKGYPSSNVIIVATSMSDRSVSARHELAISFSPLTGNLLSSSAASNIIIDSTEKIQLAAQVSHYPDTAFKWTSSNPKVATVDAKGVVTALNVGSATITCKLLDGSGKSGTVAVKVYVPVNNISLGNTKAIAISKKLQLSASVMPQNATNKKIIWSIVDKGETNASITSSGLLTAGSKAGTIEVKALIKDFDREPSISYSIKISDKITTSLALKDGDAVISKAKLINAKSVGSIYQQSIDLGATLVVEPADSAPSVAWTSSNPKIATVDSEGNVTAIAKGKVTIKATAQDGSAKTAACSIEVIEPVKNVGISIPYKIMPYGKNMTVRGVTTNAGAGDKSGVYSLEKADPSDPEISEQDVKISEKGVLSVASDAKISSVVVRFTSNENPTLSASETVIFNNGKVIKLRLAKPSTTIYVNDTEYNSALVEYETFYQYDNSLKPIIGLESSNPKVATVDDSNRVTAVSPGKATITVRAMDSSGLSAKLVVTVGTAVEDIELTLPHNNISVGSSMAIKADIFPKNATSKKPVWRVDNASRDAGVTISSSGVLAVPASATSLSQIEITAIAADRVERAFDTIVNVYNNKVKALAFKKAGYVVPLDTTTKMQLNTELTVLGTNAAGDCISPSASDTFAYTSSNPAVADIDARTGELIIKATGATNITVTALDGSKKTAKTKISVNNSVTSLTVESPEFISKGSSVQIKALVNADATNKKLEYSIQAQEGAEALGGGSGASISTSGRLSIPSNYLGTKVTVLVKSACFNALSKTVDFSVVAKPTSIRLTYKSGLASDQSSAIIKQVNDPSHVTKANMLTQNIVDSFYDEKDSNVNTIDTLEASLTLNASELRSGNNLINLSSNRVKWTSSNPKVVTVSSTGLVSAVGAGTATVKAATTDGSGKIASCLVSVNVPVSSLNIMPKREGTNTYYTSLAHGKSLSFSITTGTAYGKPNNTKVMWNAYVINSNGTLDFDASSGYLTMSSSGKLTIKNSIKNDPRYNKWCRIYVTAMALDGSGAFGIYSIVGVPPTTTLEFERATEHQDPDSGRITGITIPINTDSMAGDFTVKSSNPNVASFGKFGKDEKTGFVSLYLAYPRDNGTATITLIANDNGKKISAKLKVNINPTD